MTGYESKRAMARDKLIELAKDGMGMHSPDAPEYIVCEALIEALAQPAQEPKSVTYNEVADTMNALRKGNFSQKAAAEEVGKLKLYTTPPQRTWVGLTDEETLGFTQHEMAVVKYVSKVLQEKNNAA